MPVDDSAADPESDAIAFVTLGREERLEDPGQGVLRHSVTGIGDG